MKTKMTPIQPFHQFSESVARELEGRWTAANSYILVKKHKEVIQECWTNNQNPIETAFAVDRIIMNRSQKMKA